MVAILIAVLVTNTMLLVGVLTLVLRHLSRIDDARRAETQELMQRIQSPADAVLQYAPQGPPLDPYPRTDEETVVDMDEELALALARADEIQAAELIL